MARISPLGGLIAVLAVLQWATVAALQMSDIFTIWDGPRDGGCDSYREVLEDWQTECLWSLQTAIEAIENRYDQDPRVRRSMYLFFGINAAGSLGKRGQRRRDVTRVKNELDFVYNFLNRQPMENNSGFMYPREGYWLFCDSTFLAGHQPSDPALDFEGKEMRNNKNEPVYIRDVDLYQDKLAVDSRIHPWWAGDLTTLNGYYFEEEGGNFCYGADDLGATATLQKLVRGSSGKAENGDRIWAVILCPEAFSNSRRPASYRDASNAISVNTNFATVIPRSTTLLHEAFHLLRGGFFDSGDDEIYDLGKAISTADSDTSRMLRNPESFVFFVTHMYHLFGERAGDNPESIPQKWDFRIVKVGGKNILGAIKP